MERIIEGTVIGGSKGDARIFHYGSYIRVFGLEGGVPQRRVLSRMKLQGYPPGNSPSESLRLVI